MLLTEEIWNTISKFIPAPKRAANGAGRPAHSRKKVLEGILWVLHSGARWKDLPKCYPSYQTCHALFQEWQRNGVFESIFHELSKCKANSERDAGFIDVTFVPAKKGARSLAVVTRAKAVQSWPSAMALEGLLASAFIVPRDTRQVAS